jgi:hypothetical protein
MREDGTHACAAVVTALATPTLIPFRQQGVAPTRGT